MGVFKQTRVFDPLELEIMDRVYEAAWAKLEALEPSRDRGKDGDRQKALRKRIFAVAGKDRVDFDTLYNRATAVILISVEPPKLPKPQPRRPSPKAAS